MIEVMKKFIKIVPVIFFFFLFCACEKWTEAEAENYETPERTAEYYANLRLWKASYGDRPVSFGWFGGWTGTGASMVGSLAGLPDSMDLVSIWGDWINMTEAKQKDLEFAQKVKGMKVMATLFLEYVGQNITPEDADRFEYWGWNPSETSTSAEPSEGQAAVIRKYAAAIADAVLSRGYDGLDIDFEGSGDLKSGPYRWKVFIEELGKYLGPKSGTDKLLAFDYFSGGIMDAAVAKDLAPYFDYFIDQEYSWQVGASISNWNNRLQTLIGRYAGDELTPQEIAKRFIITDSFEDATNASRGGRDMMQEDGTVVPAYFGMAAWEPLIGGVRMAKGGIGLYHIEYAYLVSGQNGFYPFTRKAIQIMNPADN
jgi:hypothetical protein